MQEDERGLAFSLGGSKGNSLTCLNSNLAFPGAAAVLRKPLRWLAFPARASSTTRMMQ